jgi:Flp pilus assembly protein TadG
VNRRSESGAVLVQVALALVVLCGLCALVVDMGILMVARAQAQNAADAGALAGATSLAFDSIQLTAPATASAIAVASQNMVWGAAPSVTAGDITFGACPLTGDSIVHIGITCVTVNVYRSQSRGNAIPTTFGRLLGVDHQDVQATATATYVGANVTSCVWPIAIPDKWREVTNPNTFDPSSPGCPLVPLPKPDEYTKPSADAAGTGYSINVPKLNSPVDLVLTPAPGPPYSQPLEAGHFLPVVIPRAAGSGFEANLASCNGAPMHIGQALALDSPTDSLKLVRDEATKRVGSDPDAKWDSVALRVINSCAANGSCKEPGANGAPLQPVISPRVVALPVFDLNEYEQSRCTGTPVVTVRNYVGFYIRVMPVVGGGIEGSFTTFPGQLELGAPQIRDTSSFLRGAILYR